MEAAWILYGAVNRYDTLSLLLYLANQGYLSIRELKGAEGSDFLLTKLREYDGSNSYEAKYMASLFRPRLAKRQKNNSSEEQAISREDDLKIPIADDADPTMQVRLSELYKKFYPVADEIIAELNSQASKQRFFLTTTLVIRKILVSGLGRISIAGDFDFMERLSGLGDKYFGCHTCRLREWCHCLLISRSRPVRDLGRL